MSVKKKRLLCFDASPSNALVRIKKQLDVRLSLATLEKRQLMQHDWATLHPQPIELTTRGPK